MPNLNDDVALKNIGTVEDLESDESVFTIYTLFLFVVLWLLETLFSRYVIRILVADNVLHYHEMHFHTSIFVEFFLYFLGCSTRHIWCKSFATYWSLYQTSENLDRLGKVSFLPEQFIIPIIKRTYG